MIEGRPRDQGRHFHHRLVVAQHPAQHRLHRVYEPVPATGRPGLGRAGGRRGAGAQREQEGQAYGRVRLGLPPFQQRVVVREEESVPPDARRGVREERRDLVTLTPPLLPPRVVRALFTSLARRTVQGAEQFEESDSCAVGGVGGEPREKRQGRGRGR
ncbi:hypothetical protein [Streptomyces sp. NPDC014793]|uniref:hypothetical protein n=1 Tax=Streptomyces sp. NPDC014793 TaxID=3364914 RepID=UPI0036FD876A